MNQSAHPKTLKINAIPGIMKLFLIEHLREPTTLLWTGMAPCLMFILVTDRTSNAFDQSYVNAAAWFYSYLSSSFAFFGFSFYLVGRRESGFVRSFIYQQGAVRTFLVSHTLSYSLLSLIYVTGFYLVTKPLYGNYDLIEYLHLAACFYTAYLGFCCIGLLVVALPLKFSTTSTVFSLLSFWMLISGYAGASQHGKLASSVAYFNPLSLSVQLYDSRLPLFISFAIALTTLLIGLTTSIKYFRIQPVWSRY
ncbi:hypothetical protein ACIPZ8_26700 [Pseudomonas sp. NPDC089422]|uniref:hypothetical protein n=1 Tax=Pseudomonas sp. NPDC089422 TaxID=3364466 RepID=UPI003820615A